MYTSAFWFYAFDCLIAKEITFSGTGAQAENLFKITGTVEVLRIYGLVGATTLGNLTDCYLDIFDAGGGGDPISKTTTGVMTGLVAESFVIRAEKSDKVLEIQTAATAWAEDEVDVKKESFRCAQKTGGVLTYIRFVHTSSDNPPDGTVHWHCEYAPVSDGSFLEPA